MGQEQPKEAIEQIALRRIEDAERESATSLDLSNWGLRTVPEAVGRLAHLEGLFLHNNELTALPKTFGNLTKLTHLDLSGNRLSALPETFGNLTALLEAIREALC